MTKGKIKSNSLDVQETISELTGIQGISNFKTVNFSESNIQSVVNGISETKRMANTKEKIGYLTLGGVVSLIGGEKRLAIIGRIQISSKTIDQFDYAGVLFPEGYQQAKLTKCICLIILILNISLK